MTIKVILASSSDSTIEHLRNVLDEADGIVLEQVTNTLPATQDALDRSPDTDVLLVDEKLDGGRGLGAARTLAGARPLLGMIMVSEDGGPEQFAAAMDSGARSVIADTTGLNEVVSRIEAVANWSVAARSAVTSEISGGRGGRVIVVAGAKGGVGTSAMTLLLGQALTAERTVAVVDFDLQAGDLGAYLGVHTRRSLVDLVDISGEMTGRVLRETSYDIEGGLRLLSAPNEGERSEEMTARAARAIVNSLRYQFDVSVIDVGSHLDDATATVLEHADEVVLVVTPDLPALRAARRTLSLWERLAVRAPGSVNVILNRLSRKSEVTKELAARIIETPIALAVPDGGTAFESAMNTAGIVTVKTVAHVALAPFAGRIARAPGEAAHKATPAEEPLATRRGRGSRRARRGELAASDAGQAAVELPIVIAMGLVVFLLCAQAIAWGAGYMLARNAAQEGARTVSVAGYSASSVDQARADARDELTGSWRSSSAINVGSETVEVRLKTPTIIPGVTLTSSATAAVFDEPRS